ncbi:hypothetical protein [Stappia indica]|uniref:hypothetical protein n=1 Tax=Stappia indica TaxID=538381 RepID=UPI001D17E40C|nr:hypothetical protein [Stappia indica]MCC4247076.1 hypothetical protein [Stappia indica]
MTVTTGDTDAIHTLPVITPCAALRLAAFRFFAILLAAYLLSGSARAVLVDPAAGPLAGALLEAVWLVSAGLLGTALMPWGLLTPRRAVALAVLTGLGLALGDALVAIFLCGIPVPRHFARFAQVHGAIQAAAFLVALLLPALLKPGGK